MKSRNYGIDLLKIICMFLVIAFHYADHGRVPLSASSPITFNWVILAVSRVWGGLCNAVFMLVTGYYLSADKKFSWEKVIRLYLMVYFFTLVTDGICIAVNHGQADAKFIICMIFPLASNKYWYFTTYFLIYFFHRYLNVILDHISQKQHFALCALGIGIFSVFYTLGGIITLPAFESTAFSSWAQTGNSMVIFLMLYFVGAYLRKYKVKVTNAGVYLVILLACEVATLFFMVVFARRYHDDSLIYYFSWGTEKVFPVFTAIFAFLAFKDLKIKGAAVTRAVSFLAPSVFGVYLFHIGDLRWLIFGQILDNTRIYQGPFMIFHMLMAMVVLFAIGILLDKFRRLVLERPLTPLIKGVAEGLDQKTAELFP